MNPYYDTYEEYIEYDREYRIYESMIEIRYYMIDSVDRDDMEYPPLEYWNDYEY